jgi:hypothetical protein
MLVPQGFIGSEVGGAEHKLLVSVEIKQKLGNYPRPDDDEVLKGVFRRCCRSLQSRAGGCQRSVRCGGGGCGGMWGR